LHEFVSAGKRYSTYDPEWSAELNQKNERLVVLEKALGHEARCETAPSMQRRSG
jgi:hypothetical protein